jgi:hypothetical protein
MSVAQLLVEGKDDRHVVWALCAKHQLPERFSVEIPGQGEGGVDPLLDSIPVRLKIARLRALGIVLDADTNLQSRWQAIVTRLQQAGYVDFPETPDRTGTIIIQTGKPKVGVWIMPDNQLLGMIEHFVTQLIPSDDHLLAKATATLNEIEAKRLHRYLLIHRQKALIHTWLAWQALPGQPMGQAITAKVLQHDSPLALLFVQWLDRLFDLSTEVG